MKQKKYKNKNIEMELFPEAEDMFETNIVAKYFQRTLVITGHINEETSKAFYMEVHRLLNENPDDAITILIDSEGGDVDAAFSIYQMMKYAQQFCTVRTICYSKAYSAASLLLAAGTFGARYLHPFAKIMVHGVKIYFTDGGNVKGYILPTVENAHLDEKILHQALSSELTKHLVSEEDVKAMTAKVAEMMKSETYVSDTEAIEGGFVDIVGIPKLTSSYVLLDLSEEELKELEENNE